MKLLTWSLRLAIFIFLFVFAVQNTDVVTLKFFLGSAWQAPLVLVLLVFFAGGAILGILSLVGVIYRQRREIARLKREALVTPVPEIVVPPPA